MEAHVIRPADLTPGQLELWRDFQSARAELSSPFFSPEFTLAIGAARSDAYVAVLSEQGNVRGFLPFHRRSGGVAKPIGGPISDYQGLICDPAFAPDAASLLSACKLTAYDFNHAPVSQTALHSGATHFSVSPQMDISSGYESYVASASGACRKSIKETARRIRKLEQETGPARFEMNNAGEDVWRQLVALKNSQYERIGVGSILDVPWVDRALAMIRGTSGLRFSGLLSTVHAGDRLIAAHLGMRTDTTLCWWFNTHDAAMRVYAPGLVLLVAAAKAAAEEGLKVIDFGRGTEDYKMRFANRSAQLCEGSVEVGASLPGSLRRLQKFGIRACRRLPLGRYESLPRRALNRLLTNMRLPDPQS